MIDNTTETLGQVIKKKRLQLGLSLRDLAQLVSIHHSTIDRIEQDKFKVIDPAILKAIADALHLDQLYLLSFIGAGVKDEDIRIIARAVKKMTTEQRQLMMKMLIENFPEAFENSDTDDLDGNWKRVLTQMPNKVGNDGQL